MLGTGVFGSGREYNAVRMVMKVGENCWEPGFLSPPINPDSPFPTQKPRFPTVSPNFHNHSYGIVFPPPPKNPGSQHFPKYGSKYF